MEGTGSIVLATVSAIILGFIFWIINKVMNI